jgi:hypothetical protein
MEPARSTVAEASAADDLESMVATLCSYENWFGPRHPQTLTMMVIVADACRRRGEFLGARLLLERTIRDAGLYLHHTHDVRLKAIGILRDLCLEECEMERAGALQRELLDCKMLRWGAGHPETLAARADLATILMSPAQQRREV